MIVYRGFRDFVGPYVAHCHNLAHEDHAMMFGWEITRDADSGPPARIDETSQVSLVTTLVAAPAEERSRRSPAREGSRGGRCCRSPWSWPTPTGSG